MEQEFRRSIRFFERAGSDWAELANNHAGRVGYRALALQQADMYRTHKVGLALQHASITD